MIKLVKITDECAIEQEGGLTVRARIGDIQSESVCVLHAVEQEEYTRPVFDAIR